jgi:hypothetical protein
MKRQVLDCEKTTMPQIIGDLGDKISKEISKIQKENKESSRKWTKDRQGNPAGCLTNT